NSMPPAAEVSRDTVARRPAVASPKWNSSFSVVRAMTYSTKSMASSIQPSLAARSACHCCRVMVRYHGTDGVGDTEVAEARGGASKEAAGLFGTAGLAASMRLLLS